MAARRIALFTDEPVTPTRVETLVDLLRGSQRKFDRKTLLQVLQPAELPGVRSEASRTQAQNTIKAALELELIRTDPDGTLLPTFESSDPRPTSEIVLAALDDRVLGVDDVEPYFAPFYSYLLALGPAASTDQKPKQWAIAFEGAVYGGTRPDNPFNEPKYTGLHRWYPYAGLGWEDTSGIFQPVPYERLRRRLGRIFSDERRLPSDEFMNRLAVHCPELDGGEIYRETNRHDRADHLACTLGLSHALLELHEDKVIRLEAPRDARGWSLAAAQPSYDGETLQSDRFDFAVYLGGAA
jgi:hypothetical protein